MKLSVDTVPVHGRGEEGRCAGGSWAALHGEPLRGE